MKSTRLGLGKGMGCGYRNIVIKDPMIHGLSAKGVKQHFMYHNPQGSFYAMDVYAEDMKEAREKVRQKLGVKRLSDRVAIWKKLDAKGKTQSDYFKKRIVKIGSAEDKKILEQYTKVEAMKKELEVMDKKLDKLRKYQYHRFGDEKFNQYLDYNLIVKNKYIDYGKEASKYNDMVRDIQYLKAKHTNACFNNMQTYKTVRYNETQPIDDGTLVYQGKMYGSKNDLKYMPDKVRIVKLSAKKSCIDKYLPKVKPKQYLDKRLVEQGIKVEMEHTKNREIARRIAIAHLNESKLYYYQLAKMEKTL